jgi:hypothetical protein
MESSLRVSVCWTRVVCEEADGELDFSGVDAEGEDGGDEDRLDGGDKADGMRKRDSSDVPGPCPAEISKLSERVWHLACD